MRRKLMLTVLSVVLVAGLLAAAHEAAGSPMFDRLDANKDGAVSKDEFPGSPRAFESLDADGSGSLSSEEFGQGPGPGRERRGGGGGRPQGDRRGGGPNAGMGNVNPLVALCDADGDGAATEAEVLAAFRKFDADGDGRVSRGEAVHEARTQVMLYHLDKNKDGTITQDEAGEGTWDRVLSRMDADGDGKVTPGELAKGRPGAGGREGARGREQGQEGRKAEQGRRDPGEWMKRMDANGDGFLVADEVDEQMWNHLQQADTDGDGKVSAAELTEIRKRAGSAGRPGGGGKVDPKRMMERLDKNGDGAISQGEVDEGTWRHFGRADKNGDGNVSADELETMLQQRRGPGGGMRRDPARMVKHLDTDGDDMLSRDEWKGPQEAFDKIDLDSDGYLTAEELDTQGQKRE